MNHQINPNIFQLPDNLEDILSFSTMIEKFGDENAGHIFDSIKAINELVLVDQENDCCMVIDGGFSYQIIGMSTKIILEKTHFNIPYLKEIVKMFYLEELINLPEELLN